MSSGKGTFVYTLEDVDSACKMAQALSSPIRLKILKLLINQSMTMGELAKELFVSLSSVSMHIKSLEEVGLVTAVPKPGMHGTQKLCGIKSAKVIFDFFSNLQGDLNQIKTEVLNIPIGSYSHAHITSPCGIVSKTNYIGTEDTPYVFHDVERIHGELLWFTDGFLKYSISNKSLKENIINSVDISFEVCAEAPGYNNKWPSDIFFKVNDKKITTFNISGDYGGTRGVNNPRWWPNSNTQYGELKVFSITNEGTFLNGNIVSKETMKSLGIDKDYYFTIDIGVDETSEFKGGINLFGKSFGNYAQDIKIEINYY